MAEYTRYWYRVNCFIILITIYAALIHLKATAFLIFLVRLLLVPMADRIPIHMMIMFHLGPLERLQHLIVTEINIVKNYNLFWLHIRRSIPILIKMKQIIFRMISTKKRRERII